MGLQLVCSHLTGEGSEGGRNSLYPPRQYRMIGNSDIIIIYLALPTHAYKDPRLGLKKVH